MACPSNDTLIRFAYQDTAPNEMKEIAQHIERCTICRNEVASIAALDEGLSHLINSESGTEPAGQDCPDAMLLATYLDQNLSLQERERLEAHLARCSFCSDGLLAVDERLHTASVGSQATPSHLLEQAVRLGAMSERAARPSQAGGVEQILEKFRQWVEPLFSHRYWALAGATGCAVIAFLFAQQIYRGKPEPELEMRSRGRPSTEEVIAGTQLTPTAEITAALQAYSAKPAADSQAALLAALKGAAPQIPTNQVSKIEIDRTLAEKLTSDRKTPKQIRVRLYQGGLLVVSEDR